MTDIVDSQTRSRMMAGIRGKDTKQELALRRSLHALGFRYRLHAKGIPGKPDLVLPKYKAVIFVHGCFWHRHDCRLGRRLPKSNLSYWLPKLERNMERDKEALARLAAAGWDVLVIWECETKDAEALARTLTGFLGAPRTP